MIEQSQTCGCNIDYSGQRCRFHADTPLRQVGWLGPYGLIPGGMDVDPAPHWQPVYVKQADGSSQAGEPRD